jgi:hypothetical protein
MNRILFVSAFGLGAGAILWMASYFLGSDPLALAVTLVIGCVYTIGFAEMLQFRRATDTLSNALGRLPQEASQDRPFLEEWLAGLHPSLHNAVRLRIQGERVALPAPVLTPYLVGLLVMLGLLGTFVGMVETLKGAVLALEGTTELQAIRAGLAAPINGLSLAFGTSVAGVAASAMLGLISTLSRRDRMLATRQLDSAVGGVLQTFSVGYQRRAAYEALQSQANALPAVAQTLQDLASKLECMGDTLGERLIANQENFHRSAESAYAELAASVDRSLADSLTRSAELAGESIKPHLAEAMAGISAEAVNTHRHLAETSETQLREMSERLEQLSGSLLNRFDESAVSWLEQQQAGETRRLAHWNEVMGESREAAVVRFEQLSDSLSTHWSAAGDRMEDALAGLQEALKTLRKDEEERSQHAGERLVSLESTVAEHLGRLGRELEAPMSRLIETASETPRAAAEVISQLREEIGNNLRRDNELLAERARIVADLDGLSASLQQAVASQGEAVSMLVDSSTELLRDVGEGFAERIDGNLSRLSEAGRNLALGGTEMASLAQGFGLAVEQFSQSNARLVEQLASIGESMDASSARSDEQMGYYVAQAREIIDQSLLSQREVFEELRELSQQVDKLPAEAEAG